MYDSGGGAGGPGDMKKSQPHNNNNQPNAVNHNQPLALRPRHLPQYQHPELEELTGQEISLDLQHLIEDQFRDQEGMALLQEILPGARPTVPTNGVFSRPSLAYMPQGVHQGAYSNEQQQDSPPVKEEPPEAHDYQRQCQQRGPLTLPNAPFPAAAAFPTGATYATNGAGGSFLPPGAPPHLALKHKTLHNHNHGHGNPNSRRHAGKALDKGTDEYRRRRERNNIAVRKSREKAKVRSREVEEKVKALMREKDALLKRLEAVSGELSLHKQMYVHLMNLNHPEITDLCRSMLNLGSGEHPMLNN